MLRNRYFLLPLFCTLGAFTVLAAVTPTDHETQAQPATTQLKPQTPVPTAQPKQAHTIDSNLDLKPRAQARPKAVTHVVSSPTKNTKPRASVVSTPKSSTSVSPVSQKKQSVQAATPIKKIALNASAASTVTTKTPMASPQKTQTSPKPNPDSTVVKVAATPQSTNAPTATKSKELSRPDTIATKLETVRVQYAQPPKSLTYQSIIRPVIASIIHSPAAGTIHETQKEYGSNVNKNDVIVSLSSDTARNELMTNTSNLLSTQARYQTAMSNLKKNIALHKKGIISEQELTTSEGEFVQVLIELTRVKLQFDKAADILGFDTEHLKSANIGKQLSSIIDEPDATQKLMSKLLSNDSMVKIQADATGTFLPNSSNSGVDGKVLHLKFGQEVEKGQNIGIVTNPKKIEMHLTIPEFDAVKMRSGQAIQVSIPAVNKKLSGEITQIRRFEYQSRQGQTPTIPVVAEADCDECEMLYSISCHVTVLESTKKTLQVPISAVEKEGNNYFVKKMINHKAIKTKVQIGPTTKTTITIKSGLKEGDEVVKDYTSN